MNVVAGNRCLGSETRPLGKPRYAVFDDADNLALDRETFPLDNSEKPYHLCHGLLAVLEG